MTKKQDMLFEALNILYAVGATNVELEYTGNFKKGDIRPTSDRLACDGIEKATIFYEVLPKDQQAYRQIRQKIPLQYSMKLDGVSADVGTDAVWFSTRRRKFYVMDTTEIQTITKIQTVIKELRYLWHYGGTFEDCPECWN